MEQIKVLWIGDGVIPTGFARVNHSIILNLSPEYQVHHLAINYRGDPHSYSYPIYPAILGGDVYGLGRLPSMIQALRPDLIFILNDAWMIDAYLNVIKQSFNDFKVPIVTYFPVDAEEHSPEFYKNFDIVDGVCVYTNFAKDVLLDARSPNIHARSINVIPHGITKKLFFPMDVTLAKEIVYPKDRIDEFLNSFIILNANRNQPRKRIDITMWAFAEFQKNKPEAKLYMHMGVLDLGVNIIELAKRYGFENKLVLSTQQDIMPNVPDNKLNLIYNATEVGLNTGIGEGWGLTSWEHGATGKPQIIPKHSSLEEIWGEGRGLFAEIVQGNDGRHMMERVNTVGRVPDIESIVEQLNFLYNDWRDNGYIKGTEIGNLALNYIQQPKFEWENVAKQFEKVFKKALRKYNRIK